MVLSKKNTKEQKMNVERNDDNRSNLSVWEATSYCFPLLRKINSASNQHTSLHDVKTATIPSATAIYTLKVNKYRKHGAML